MSKHAKGELNLEKIIEGEASARGKGFRDAMPAGQIPNRRGYEPPVVVWDDGKGSRLQQMMRAYARRNGGLWPYF